MSQGTETDVSMTATAAQTPERAPLAAGSRAGGNTASANLGATVERVLDNAWRGIANPRTQARAAFALTCLLVVAIAWLLADTLWFMATGSNQNATNTRPAAARARAAAAPNVDLQRVAEQHLFGVAAAPAPAAETGPAPVTSLPLQLLGVFVARPASESTAVIAEQSHDGDLFKVGDAVPGNAVLTEVHNDRVVLQRGTERETLSFPATEGAGFANNTEPADGLGGEFVPVDQGVLDVQPVEAPEVEPGVADPAQTSARSGTGATLAQYRDRLKSEPTNVLSEIGMQPINGGSAHGYRVGDNVASGLGRVGLQPGDVVLTVNGRPVGNIQNDQQQVDSVMSQGSARLEIQRGNRRFFVTASLR